jgi:hypothetical protein
VHSKSQREGRGRRLTTRNICSGSCALSWAACCLAWHDRRRTHQLRDADDGDPTFIAYGDYDEIARRANAGVSDLHRPCNDLMWRCALSHAASCDALHDGGWEHLDAPTNSSSPLHTAAGLVVPGMTMRGLAKPSDHTSSIVATLAATSTKRTLLLCSHEEGQIAKERNPFPFHSLAVAIWWRKPSPRPIGAESGLARSVRVEELVWGLYQRPCNGQYDGAAV